MDEVGCVHGRFQLFHNDHLAYVQAAKQMVKFVWIGIAKFDIAASDANPLGRDRDRPENNPLTYFERITMISEALTEAGMRKDEFGFVPRPIETRLRLSEFMPPVDSCYLRFLRGLEPRKNTCVASLRLRHDCSLGAGSKKDRGRQNSRRNPCGRHRLEEDGASVGRAQRGTAERQKSLGGSPSARCQAIHPQQLPKEAKPSIAPARTSPEAHIEWIFHRKDLAPRSHQCWLRPSSIEYFTCV